MTLSVKAACLLVLAIALTAAHAQPPRPTLPPGYEPEILPLGKPGVPVVPPPPVTPPPKVQPPADTMTIEMNVNRPGGDYRNFALAGNQANPQACQQACLREAQCVAFTYVLPHFQGPNAICWLKNQVPAAVASQPCCVSGIRVRRP